MRQSRRIPSNHEPASLQTDAPKTGSLLSSRSMSYRSISFFALAAPLGLAACAPTSVTPSESATEDAAAVVNPNIPLPRDAGPAASAEDSATPAASTSDARPSEGTVSKDEAQTGVNFDLPSDEAETTVLPATSAPTLSSRPDSSTAEPLSCDDCPASDDPCWTQTCNPVTGRCEREPAALTACDDGDRCTRDDTCGEDGVCAGAPLECPDDAPGTCLTSVCNPESGMCQQVPRAAAAECDDADACTTNDACDDLGNCRGIALECSGMDASCAVGTCNSDTGACEARPVDLGETCDDGDACTSSDQCDGAGACAGTRTDCSQLDGVCTAGACNPDSGACEAVALTGTPCDDADACTQNDQCDQGSCAGTIPDTCETRLEVPISTQESTLLLATECGGVALANDFNVKRLLTDASPEAQGDCTDSGGADVFVSLDLSDQTEAVRLLATTDNRETDFDTVLILVGSSSDGGQQCAYDQLVACNDALNDNVERSTLDVVVPPGVYTLIVDGYIARDRGQAALSVAIGAP